MFHFGCACHPGLGRRGLVRAAAEVGTAAATVLSTLGKPALAQGTQTQPQRATPGQRVIDIHAHYFPESYLELIAKEGERYGATYRQAPEGWYLGVRGVSPATVPLPTKFIDLKQRLADMDASGVTVQALSLTSPMVYWADGEFAERLCRAWNDAASEAHKAHPDRLVGLAILPMQDTDRAIRELARVKSLPGIRGIYCGTNVNNKDLSEPAMLPIWQAIAAADMPVFLHPLQTVGGERMKFYMSNFIGNPVDSAIAAGHLIFGGVLDACPTLQVNLPHAGGVLPILIGRFDHGSARRPETRHMTKAPSDYLKRFTYDTIAHSPEIMRFVISMVGVDRIVVGSDYCYDMGYERPVEFVDRLGLDAEQRSMVLGGTASRLLKL
jgi:aminocarboxymuconate-semialdehyde decarboxylase